MRGAFLAFAVSFVTFAFVVLALDAHAEDALPLELAWEAPPECASAEQIRSELDRIARVRPGRTVAHLTAQGRIEKTDNAYRLSLRTEQNGEAGERTLVAGDCRTLEREVTLVLALAFGEGVEIVSEKESEASPNAETQATADEPSKPAPPEKSTPQPSSAPTASVTAVPRDTTRSSTSEPLRAAVLAGGGVLFGTLPSPAGFVTTGATLGTRRVWLDARALWIPRVEQSLTHGVSARYEGLGGALSGCAVLPFAAMVSACLSLEASALAARSSGATESVRAVAPLFSVAPAVSWQWPSRGAWSLRLEAALHVALNEPRFVVEGLGEAYRVPLLSPSLDAVVVFSPGR